MAAFKARETEQCPSSKVEECKGGDLLESDRRRPLNAGSKLTARHLFGDIYHPYLVPRFWPARALTRPRLTQDSEGKTYYYHVEEIWFSRGRWQGLRNTKDLAQRAR